MLKNKPAIRLTIIIAVALIAIVYISFHIYNTLKPTVTLTAARYETMNKSESVSGYILKDDKLIISPYSGYVEYLFEDGERVSAKSIVANVYPNAPKQQFDLLVRINKIIKKHEKCKINSTVSLNELSEQIELLQKSINDKSFDGQATWILDNQEELERLKSIKKMILDGKTDMSSELSVYRVLREQQLMYLGNSFPIITEESGYFFSSYDGYEGLLTTDKIESSPSSYSDFDSIVKVSPNNAIGSMVTSISWYYECLVEINQSEKYVPNTYYNVFFNERDDSLKMLLQKKTVDRQKGQAVLTFYSSVVNSDSKLDRKTTAHVVTESATGLKVKIDDVYMIDGVSCVYIFNEGVANLREVNIIFEMSGYYLVDKNTTGKYKYLNLNDLVISNQSDLYDGKVIG